MIKVHTIIWIQLIQISVQNTAVQNGQQQYEVIQRDTKMPRYGACWTDSLRDLEQGCKQLNDELQSRLALNFANCFLAQAGQRTYPCMSTEEIATCLRGMDSNAFSAYSNFFTVSYLDLVCRCYSLSA